MRLTLLALSATLPLAASVNTYTDEVNKKFENGCATNEAYTITDNGCATNEEGESQCNSEDTCNSFIRNAVSDTCYLYAVPVDDIAGCTVNSPVTTGKHT